MGQVPSRLLRLLAVALAGGLVAGACGQRPVRYELGPEPTTSTSAPPAARRTSPPATADGTPPADGATPSSASASTPRASTVTTARAAAPSTAPAKPWVAVTGNLTGIPSECGNVSFVTARPDNDAVVVGIALHGLFESTGGRAAWQPLGTGKGSAAITNRMSSVVFDPTNPAVFYESGVYNGDGVYRTSDGGATFVALGDIRHIDMVSVDFTDPARRTMLAGMHESNVLYRTSDGGRTWTDVSGNVGIAADVGFAASVHVVDGNTHLLGSRNGGKAGVYRTTDGGTTWTRTWNTAVVGRMLLAQGGAWYWLLDNGNGVIRSTDSGVSWKRVGGAGRIAPTASGIVELPDGRLASWGSTIVVSSDGGATWKAFGATLPYAPWGMTYSAAQKAFYVWRFDCFATGDNAVPADGVMRMDASAL